MGAGMTVTTDNQATGQAQPQFRANDMDDTLPGLVDIEHLDAAWRAFPSAKLPIIPARS